MPNLNWDFENNRPYPLGVYRKKQPFEDSLGKTQCECEPDNCTKNTQYVGYMMENGIQHVHWETLEPFKEAYRAKGANKRFGILGVSCYGCYGEACITQYFQKRMTAVLDWRKSQGLSH